MIKAVVVTLCGCTIIVFLDNVHIILTKQMMKRFFLIFVSVFLIQSSLSFAQVADNQSLSALQESALGGDAEAQYLLGKRYYDGDGVTQDYDQAVSWYRKAAERRKCEG